MLDGGEGRAVQAAMDLLVRYGEALGAESLVETNNVCGANIFGPRHVLLARQSSHDGVFSELSLDSSVPVVVPPVRAYSCQL